VNQQYEWFDIRIYKYINLKKRGKRIFQPPWQRFHVQDNPHLAMYVLPLGASKRFHTCGYPNSWMVCFMENPNRKWMIFRGTPILGNLHINYIYIHMRKREPTCKNNEKEHEQCKAEKKHKTWDALGMFQSIIIKNKNGMCVYVEKTKERNRLLYFVYIEYW
jgi:hypothetical protein